MNLLQLKYAVEIDRTRSINKAAENLYMGQPNLSRAIRELENSLGIKIFRRTSKGMTPTPQGEEFLIHARRILAQVAQVEELYKSEAANKQRLSISVPRASYLACAFTEFTKTLDSQRPIEIYYKETNSMEAINNILQEDYRLGIIRYQTTFDSYFKDYMREKDLDYELILEFSYVAAVSRSHELAQAEDFKLEQLGKYTEIAHSDPFVPSLPFFDAKKAELSEYVDKRIFVFERGSQFDLLTSTEGTFMWVSPIPKSVLAHYGIVQKQSSENNKLYRDMLIYRRGTRFTELEKRFLEEVKAQIRELG